MPEFLELLSPSQAIGRLFENYHPHPESELVNTIIALNRVTYSPMMAPHPLPMFIRSTVDGYAVRASDTFGASGNLPAYMQIVGEIQMGSVPDFDIKSHQCALIHTGGMLPVSADAVVMIEYTQRINDLELEVLNSVGPNENVIKIGEDVSTGEEILPSGTRLRPADIGGLLALGIIELLVAKRPRVGILSSGDELVKPESDVNLGQVRDINSFSLSAFVVTLRNCSVQLRAH
jgi:molybdopterin molybdotransferase